MELYKEFELCIKENNKESFKNSLIDKKDLLEDKVKITILEMIEKFSDYNILEEIIKNKQFNNIYKLENNNFTNLQYGEVYEFSFLNNAFNKNNFCIIKQAIQLGYNPKKLMRNGIIKHNNKQYQLHFNFIGWCLMRIVDPEIYYYKDIAYLRNVGDLIEYLTMNVNLELNDLVVEKHIHHNKSKRIDQEISITINEKIEGLIKVEKMLRENVFVTKINDNFVRANIFQRIIDLLS